MKEKENQYSHLGSYGVIIRDNKILLINKKGGPYDGKLDLPGGTIDFGERPSETVVRELAEEVGIKVTDFDLIGVDSVCFPWNYKNMTMDVHHICIFYEIKKYDGEIVNNMNITEKNNDSKGAMFYDIDKLSKESLSRIAQLLLETMGYTINK